MKKALLIDGNSLFFKAFWSTWYRSDEGKNKYKNVDALRVFSLMIINLKSMFKPNLMMVAFDERGGHTHRHKFDYYKGNRKEQPQELYDQIPLIREFLDLYGVKWYSKKEYEADDIIGIYSKKLFDEGYHVDIITTDQDLLQLVNNNVDVYLSKTGVSKMDKHDIYNFTSKNNGLSPLQIIEYKSIAGDSSDNIKGIPGIGHKGAINLLNQYKTLENIYNYLDQLSASLRKKFLDYKDGAYESHMLATILQDGDIELDNSHLIINTPLWDNLKEFCRENYINMVDKKLEKERAENEDISNWAI